MKKSVLEVVCYDWSVTKVVCYEYVLLRMWSVSSGLLCYRQVLPATTLLYKRQTCWNTQIPETARTDSNGFQPIKIQY